MVTLGIVAIIGFIVWFFAGLFNLNKELSDEQIEDLERQLEIESGVIKSNAKADNAIHDSDLDKRVREEYANKSR